MLRLPFHVHALADVAGRFGTLGCTYSNPTLTYIYLGVRLK